jgi:hypothetical protein
MEVENQEGQGPLCAVAPFMMMKKMFVSSDFIYGRNIMLGGDVQIHSCKVIQVVALCVLYFKRSALSVGEPG